MIVARTRPRGPSCRRAGLQVVDLADLDAPPIPWKGSATQLTLNTYGHMRPDADESARAAVGAVLATRADSLSKTKNLAD